MRLSALLLAALGTLPIAPVGAQLAAPGRTQGEVAAATPGQDPVLTSVAAVPSAVPPVIDGRGDDAVWATAPVIERFRIFSPKEDSAPTFRTEARVAYDARNLYVLVRAFDPHPDSIRSRLARRDARAGSDEIKILVDAYHDRRTGFEFAISSAGVKRDIAIANDSDEDISWDAVWDAEARVDSLGWTAEFRIPLSQLRYTAAPSHTFGFAVARDIARLDERVSWPVYRRSRAGIASQLGELTGIRGLASPRRLEVVPYTVARTSNEPRGGGYRQQGDLTMGADLKYGVTSNLTIDATVNPDFGQVEADPSQLNLSAFETFFQEQRPFFLEGQGLFRFDTFCDNGCQGLFYSRRIGRAPQLGGTYFADENPTSTTILGAAKLSGRLPSGLTLGVLDAMTRQMHGANGATIEPKTNYLVARAQQDFRGGKSTIGGALTGVLRSLDEFSDRFLRRRAITGGLDARHRWHDDQWEVSGYVAASSVAGSAAAIARTQRSSTHYFQRPDGGLVYDTTRTALGGSTASVSVAKIGGGVTRHESIYQYTSPGYEPNDVGYLPRADQQALIQTFGLHYQQTPWFRSLHMNAASYLVTTAATRMRTDLGGNVNAHVSLLNNWSLHGGVNSSGHGAYCDRCARGGPAVRESPNLGGFAGFSGDDRMRVRPRLFAHRGNNADGRSPSWGVSPGFDVRLSSRFNASIGGGYSHEHDDSQWIGNYGVTGADSTHYTFAHLDQRTMRLFTRLDVTATRTLSLQVYAQPFITTGAYSNWRELRDPRAATYDDRYRPYGSESLLRSDNDFNFKQLRATSVVRWEYRPGSTLFFVWTQQRTQDELDPGSFSAWRDYRNLFDAHPKSVFLVKGSYWLSA